MSEELKAEDANGENIDSQEAEALTMEQVEKLVAERLANNNKEWQSRFDKLRNEKTEAEKALEDGKKSWEERLQSEVSALKKQVEDSTTQTQMERLRAQAIKSVSGAGLDFDDVEEKLVYKLIDPTADDPLADVNAYVEREKAKAEKIKLTAADEFAKKHGRKVQDTKPGTWDGLTYKDLAAMPVDEFNRIPTEVVERITKAALEK